MNDVLKQNGHGLAAEAYITAQQFIKSLGYEARFPMPQPQQAAK